MIAQSCCASLQAVQFFGLPVLSLTEFIEGLILWSYVLLWAGWVTAVLPL